MLERELKLYKYPVLFVFIFFWLGIFVSSWGFYAVLGFFFGTMLLRYVFGRDILYLSLFFIVGFLHSLAQDKLKSKWSRSAITATVVRKGVVKVDSVIGGDNEILGKKIRIKGLSGFENCDILRMFVDVKGSRENILYGTPIKIEKVGSKNSFLCSVNRFLKEKIEELSDKEDVKGLLLGVLIGYRDFIPYGLMQTFKKTGTMHILALSGLHIGILITIMYFLFIPLLGHRNRAFFAAVLFTLLYMGIVGTSPSILRAYIVFVVIAISRILKRRTSIYNAIGIAGLLSLIIWPHWAFSFSFMLSYLAIMGVLYYNSVLNVKNSYLKFLFASLGVMLFTMPLTSYLTGYVPVLSFIFNIVVIPLFGLLMWIFISALSLYVIMPFTLPVVMTVVNFGGKLFIGMIDIFSKVSILVKWKIYSPVAVVAYFLAILSLPVIIKILKNKEFFRNRR